MSKYWDPAWERPTAVMSLLNPTREEMELFAEDLPEGWDDPPGPTDLCVQDGYTWMATFGPDDTLLVPAPERVLTAELQKRIGALNYYFICTRPRIRAVHESRLTDDSAELRFEVSLDDGSVERLERTLPRPPNVQALSLVDHGASICYELDEGIAQHDATLTAQALFRTLPYEPSFFDLEVHYIGRARGALSQTCALDRLESHPKYQAVLESVLKSQHRNRDVWLVLGAGTNMDILSAAEQDLQPLPAEELVRRGNKLRSVLSRSRRIDITEALLINHFKPPLNEQHVGRLDLGTKTFKHCRDAGLTGLHLVFATHDWALALYTEHTGRKLWHVKTVCVDR